MYHLLYDGQDIYIVQVEENDHINYHLASANSVQLTKQTFTSKFEAIEFIYDRSKSMNYPSYLVDAMERFLLSKGVLDSLKIYCQFIFD